MEFSFLKPKVQRMFTKLKFPVESDFVALNHWLTSVGVDIPSHPGVIKT